MSYDFLKKLYGKVNEGEAPRAMTYAELEAAIDADKSIKPVDLLAGGYVGKDKLDAKIAELNGVRQQLTDANATIQSYKDMDIDGIKQSAANWEQRYNTETAQLQEQLAAQARSHAEDMFLSGYQFTSTAAKKGILAELRDKEFRLDDSGNLLGAKEFMDSLMQQDDYKGAFVAENADREDGGQGQTLPRFAGPTSSATQPSDNPFLNLFSFSHIKEPPAAHN